MQSTRFSTNNKFLFPSLEFKISKAGIKVKRALGIMAKRKSPKQLAKFMSYVLGRSPGEFGLVPDDNGYIKIKEFLRAVGEEEGFGYVRKSHINEILLSLPNPPIEINNNYIRAKLRDYLPGENQTRNPPKLLYTCVRRKAYPVVMVKGIFPMGFNTVVLSSMPDMALRIGKRRDPSPVLLNVQTQKAMAHETIFYAVGEPLYLAESIPIDCFTGPPLSKQKTPSIMQDAQNKQISPKLPGSFLVEERNLNDHKKSYQQKKKRKPVGWAREQKKKKNKPSRERPPWRR
jgi:putative RNA 2'-phosphotransferase